MQVTDYDKSEANTRLHFEALRGPGAAQAVYAAELARKIGYWESLRSDLQKHKRPLPQNAAEDLGRLQSEGLNTREKLQALHRALGQGPVAHTPAPAAAAAPVAPKPLLEQYRELAAAGNPAESQAFYWTHRKALTAEEAEANKRMRREDILAR
jgi:hypothetical protein